ncbi:ABC transporter ATP-binding protein [Agrobacterium tumefaciens]|uniref:ABC transporter ATP-binding protein n=1 Tax=Agrobacterium tumefaciens TaxID=358 RepID=UPI00287D02FE|nr:ABC transporter ATP-binding protein [Agrobacterium tumefaciens]MDS7595656.1 ABC transporter ATP-binding protein [Agrobacterium tumefaciens]
MTGSALLCQLERLGVTYGRGREPALQDIDLTIRRGRKLAIIGESGSGKSTLARAIAGLLPEHATVSGEIVWKRATGNLTSPPQAGRDIGYVFQDPGAALNPVLTIGEQVAEGAVRHLGLPWKTAAVRARELLERVHLTHPSHLLEAYPHQLSGGQRQRVATAAAIAAEPSILIADEATSALDTVSQSAIVALLDSLVSDGSRTLIFITHDIGLASSLADDIAVLHRGKLVESGVAKDVLTAPTHDYTGSLLADYIDLSTPPLISRGAA